MRAAHRILAQSARILLVSQSFFFPFRFNIFTASAAALVSHDVRYVDCSIFYSFGNDRPVFYQRVYARCTACVPYVNVSNLSFAWSPRTPRKKKKKTFACEEPSWSCFPSDSSCRLHITSSVKGAEYDERFENLAKRRCREPVLRSKCGTFVKLRMWVPACQQWYSRSKYKLTGMYQVLILCKPLQTW